MKKRMLAVMTAAVMAMSALTGCGSGGSKTVNIGVIQLTEHPALDAAYQGFVDGLSEAGYKDGENIKINFNNAQGDQSNCTTIAQKLVNDKSDLILAIATPAAQACAAQTTEIPILITAVTDPETSGLVESNKAPGGNVTGTSDLTPVAEQMKLLTQLLPEAKTVGILYCSAEDNSIFQANIAKDEATKAGLSYVEATVSNTNEIMSVVESLVGKVDVIYAPTDNMIAEGMAAVSSVATENGIPCIVGEEGMVTNGGLATYGLDYYNLGKQTAAMAVSVLKGEKKPAEMPIEYLTDCTLTINEEVAKTLNIEIPAELAK
ncbi:MAG: ABC transporter substrate-binding protein [Lachnospiraceae bacterium]|nr:ABC transporter substrate-binding protein [Lachnospiraceae bacterium]